MTDEEEADALLDMNVTLEMFPLLENNKEYQLLCDEKEKLIQNDEFIQKKVKRFDEITQRILEIYNETQKELNDGKILTDFSKQKYTSNFNSMKPSKEVFATVIKKREEEIKFREEWDKEHQHTIELFRELDIEKMINNIKNDRSQGNNK